MADVLIVGGGAAGYTGGIFAARDRRRARLLEKFSQGSQATPAGDRAA
jgi:thioredoxin reductase